MKNYEYFLASQFWYLFDKSNSQTSCCKIKWTGTSVLNVVKLFSNIMLYFIAACNFLVKNGFVPVKTIGVNRVWHWSLCIYWYFFWITLIFFSKNKRETADTVICCRVDVLIVYICTIGLIHKNAGNNLTLKVPAKKCIGKCCLLKSSAAHIW